MADPIAVLGTLNDLASRLDEASRELFRLHEQHEQTAANYDDTTNDVLCGLVDEYEQSEKRLPGEDVRNAIVTKHLREQEPILFGNYRRERAKIDRYERRAKRIEREIDAQRSILSFLKTEAEAGAA